LATCAAITSSTGASYHFTGEGTSGHIDGRRQVEAGPHENSARSLYAVDLRPPSRLRLISPLVAVLARSGMKRDLRRLKALLEAT
jgi:hypothetical protein